MLKATVEVAKGEAITCKGTGVKAVLAFIEKNGYLGAQQRIFARMPEASRALVSGLVLPSSRLPLTALVDLLESTDAVLGRGDLALCEQVGLFSASYQVGLLHKAFLAVLSMDFWFRAAGSTWNHYYSAGRLVPESMSKTGGMMRLHDFNPIGKAFCLRFAGWVRGVAEMSRLKNVRIDHPECVLDGHPSCLFRGTWTS